MAKKSQIRLTESMILENDDLVQKILTAANEAPVEAPMSGDDFRQRLRQWAKESK